MKYRLITSLILIFAFSTIVSAQKTKEPDSYNFKHGVEAFDNYSFDVAMDFFNKEVIDNPNNGYAYARIASINHLQKDYGKALSMIDLAINKIPKKDKVYKALAYSFRSNIYF